MRTRILHVLAEPVPTFLVAIVAAVAIAWALRTAWNPPLDTYLDYVPVGAVFAVFFWDRLLPTLPAARRALILDSVIVALALMRVFVPPLPFVSGHALFTTYALLTARRWPLRVLAAVVLLHVFYVKLYAVGGAASLVGGIIVAAVAARARWRRRWVD